jgi:hypothetical protein
MGASQARFAMGAPLGHNIRLIGGIFDFTQEHVAS